MLNKKTGLIALLVGFAASELMAGNFNSYAVGDVLVCFRNGGANDLVVDAGPISTFTNATHNQRISINQYTGAQLAYVSTNAVSWSAFTWFDTSVSPNWTLFVTKARTSLNVQTSPWQDKSSGSQFYPAGRMATIPPGAADEAAYIPSGALSTLNTATAVLEADISAGNSDYKNGQSYRDALLGSYGGYFNGTFQGNPENTTPASFTTSGKVVRSDFYQLMPTSGYGLGKFLGYFEFSTNGTMTYVAYPTAVPVINSISRVGNTTTIGYTTGTYGTYTLLGTNNVAAPISTWPAVSTLVNGDTSVHIATDTTTDTNRFYIITAQ
ncbi:MAG: hypothetical protein ABSD57_06155 [Verrucomicrobiota bacterium]|jgi:hypothetical protein